MKKYNVVLKSMGRVYISIETAGNTNDAIALARGRNQLPEDAKLVLVRLVEQVSILVSK